MQNLILEEKGILDLVDQAIILSFSGNEKNLHPQTVDRITFPSSFSMLNKICQFLSITRTLQYQTVYPQKFFDILPVYRPETRGGGEGGTSSLHFPAATPLLPPPPQGQHLPPPPPPSPPSIPRRKPRHGLCIQTVPRFVVRARLGRRSNACNSHEWKIPEKLRMATTIICSSLVSLASRSHPIFPHSHSSNRSLLSCSNTLCLASPRLPCL